MDGSNWVALAAVIVAGVSAAGTILAIWVAHRGSEKRLAEERRAANLAAAAKAYRLAAEVQRKINWGIVEEGARIQAEEMPPATKSTVLAAADAMELARAYGWNDKVLDAAGRVLIELVDLQHCGYAAYGSCNLAMRKMERTTSSPSATADMTQHWSSSGSR